MNKKTKKRTLSMALAAALAFSPVQAFAASSDIAGHWAEDVITQWENAGMISGYEDGTFRPNNSVTRAEFVIMMNNALGLTEAGEVSFSDVQPGNWFYNAVAIAVAAGYCSGYEDGTFKPSATITRAEAAVMIANAAGLEQDATGAAGFTDSIPAWAQGSVGAVVNAGFMSGYPDGTFAANQSITRAEAVSSLNRVIGGVTANDVVVTEATEIADQTIDGNLIIDAALTDGTVTVKNTTVKGNIVVRGGSAEALKLDGVTVEGKLIVEKEGAEVVLTGETKVPSVEISALSTLSEDNFKGSVGTITVTKNLDTDKTVKLSVAADKLVLDGTAAVDVNKDIKTVEITKDAEGSKVYVNKGATVDTVVADAKANVSGSGTVKVLEANSDGITLGSSLTVNKTEVAEGVEKPTTSTSGGGGGGGGSSSSSDDDDVSVPPTFVVDGAQGKTWKDAVKAANEAKSESYKILVKGSATGITVDDTITFTGKGTLTVQFEDGTKVTGTSLTIDAANAARIELLDNGSEAKGANFTTLTVDAPKATVNNSFAATTTDIKAVSNATFNVRDTANTIKIEKGTVNVVGGGDNVTVNVTGAGPVTIKGTVQDVDLASTGGAGSEVTLAGIVTGTIKDTNTAKTVHVVDGANIKTLTAKANVTYDLKGGTIETLAVAAETVTVAGTTVNNATVTAGKLTVNSGSVAKATVATGKVDGTGKVGTVDVTGARATVGVETVDTIKLSASATPVTVNSKTVGTIEAGATSGEITLADNAKVNTLIATEATTLADNNADNTGKIGTVVAVNKKVTVQDAKQVGSVKVSGTNGKVVDATDSEIQVEKTEISKVTLKTKPEATQYNKGQELNLSDMELTVEQTVKDANGDVTSDKPVDLTYDQAKDLLTIEGTFDSTTVGAGKTLTFKYAGLPVNDDKGQQYTYTYDVVLSQEQWAADVADALKTSMESASFVDGVKEVALGGAPETLVGTVTGTDAGVVNVAWKSSDTSYVDIQKSGNVWTATVKKADRDVPKDVTATATITSTDGKYSTTASYTFKVKAVNAGAVKTWNDIEASITKLNPIKVKDVPQDAEAAKTAIETALENVISTADSAGYTLTVKEVVPSGSNWNATLHLIEKTGATKEDYFEKQVTFTIQDEATGAKTALAKVEAKVPNSLPVASGKSQSESDVEAAIVANLQAVLGTDNQYKVSVTGTFSEKNEEEKTSTWKGTITVTGSGQDVATSTKEYTINITEGTDITLSGSHIEGTTKKVAPARVTLKAGNTTFKDVKENDVVTSWFKNLPTNLVATVKTVTADAVTIEITLPAEKTCAVTKETALDVEVPAANLKSGTALKATGTVNITIKEVITVENVTATPDHTTLRITLLNGKKFNTGTAGTYSNYAWNNKTLESGTSIQAEETTVTITLENPDKVTATQKNVSVTIQPEAFATDSIVTPADVEVEYYTPLTKDANLLKANIQDTVSDPAIEGALHGEHKAEATAEFDPDKLNVINVTTKELVQHRNGEGTLGHWTGFAIKAPEGAAQMKYAQGASEDALNTLSKLQPLEDAVDASTGKGIAIFINASSEAPRKYGAVQFFDKDGNALTPVYKFEGNLDNVKRANQGVVLEKNGTDYVIESENAATSGGTIVGGSSNTITTSTTGTVLLSGLQATGTSENAKIKVMSVEDAATVAGESFAEAFDKVTGKTNATLVDGDVVVVLSADRSVVGKYTVTVAEPSMP